MFSFSFFSSRCGGIATLAIAGRSGLVPLKGTELGGDRVSLSLKL